jgi:hypothetical protein
VIKFADIRGKDRIAMVIVTIIAAAFYFTGGNDSAKSGASASAAAAPVVAPIEPESFVTLGKGAFSCITKDQTIAAFKHAASGEKTLFSAMFSMTSNSPDGFCHEIEPGPTYKVLSVDDEDGLMQVSMQDDGSSPFWVFAAKAVVTSNPAPNTAP